MIKRLPRYAETELQRLCAKAGALCHAVDEDESGWDRLIEFPEKDFFGPVDTRPPRAVAYAQVKSVVKGKLTCRVKLSNALRAAQSPQPWFIVLVTGETCEQPSRVFAVHVWDDLIRRALKAARRAHNEKLSLHTRWITITFLQEDEKGEGLVRWMQETIDAVGPTYEAAKRAINETAGYEDGYGVGFLAIEADHEEEVLKNFLGLGGGLRINKFTFTPSRFGIVSPTPQIEISSGTVHITPQPTGEVEIRLRSSASSRTIVLLGHVYATDLPDKLDDQKRLRFSASFVELLLGPSRQFEFRAHLDGGEKYGLATIEDYAAFNEWLATGPVDLQVWIEGSRALTGELNRVNSSLAFDWSKLSSALRLLRLIAGHQNPEMSLDDLYAASGLKTFSDITDTGSLRLEFELLGSPPADPFTVILYWFHLDIGEYSFYAMAEWPVVEDIAIEGGRRRVTARCGQIVESYVLKSPSDVERHMMERDYERRRDQLAKVGVPLELDDLRTFIGAATGEQNRAV